MKSIIGKTYRKEGRNGERLYSAIQCTLCNALTYERKADKIQAALHRKCKSCASERTQAKKFQDNL